MKKTHVVNIRQQDYDVYIARPSIFGNPWSSKPSELAKFRVSTKYQAVVNYKQWLKGEAFQDVLPEKRKAILDALPQLKGRILGCFCSPSICHGDILIELIEAQEADNDGRTKNHSDQS